MVHRWVRSALGAVLALTIGMALYFGVAYLRRAEPHPVVKLDLLPAADERGELVVSIPMNPGYVGHEACAACHASRVAEFKTSRHCLACRPPRPEIMPVGFKPGQGGFEPRDSDLQFEMVERGGKYYQTVIRKTATGSAAVSSPIAFIYGSGGAADEVFFTLRDDRLFELPMVWLHPTHEWAASPFDPYGGGDFAREMTPRCVECHNTWFPHVAGSVNQYQREHNLVGISCEKCHGPGQAHVDYHRRHSRATAPHDIIRPALLPRERQMDLCAQCHSNAIKYRKPAFSYRPGEPLEASFLTLHTRRPEDDHVANQTQYLQQSRCFQQSDSLTCTTCHDPHRAPPPEGVGSMSCLNCHSADNCPDQLRLPSAVRANCAGCHMPSLNKIQVYFFTAADAYLPPVKRCEHRIAIYPQARRKLLHEWRRSQPGADNAEEAARLARDISAQALADAKRYRSEYRFLAAIDACRETLQFTDDAAVRGELDELLAVQTRLDRDFFEAIRLKDAGHSNAAISLLEQILKIKPDWAKAHGRLGSLYAAVGRRELAQQHLLEVSRNDSDDPYGEAMLGWLAYLAGRPDEALRQYRLADAREPYNARIQWEIGLAEVQLNHWHEAEVRFETALEIAPNFAAALHGLDHVLRQQGQLEMALSCGLRAAGLTGWKDAEVVLSLAETYAALGRFDEAQQAAARALQAANRDNLSLIVRIRERLEAFQAPPAPK